jgi:hypothetical protein
MNSCSPDVVSSIWMKFINLDETQPIMITLTIKISTNDFGMEFSYVDSKSKNSKSTPVDFGVESLIRYSKLELFFIDSKLEFVAKPKIPCASLERCLLMECQFFG